MSRRIIFIAFFALILAAGSARAYEKTITIPAEDSKGVTVDLKKGEYKAEIAGGAISLFYPINPNHCWLIGAAIGTDVEGAQDAPNIGTIYFEPNPPVYSQAKAEEQALAATKEGITGTYLEFSLDKDKEVRFWVSDFDYTDNSGMIKVKITSLEE